jgi:hypothetical protein
VIDVKSEIGGNWVPVEEPKKTTTSPAPKKKRTAVKK